MPVKTVLAQNMTEQYCINFDAAGKTNTFHLVNYLNRGNLYTSCA